MRIYLVRHAQTGWNIEGRAQGSTDIRLDEAGIEQARMLASRFRNHPPAEVFSSDMGRCVQTAEAISSAWGVDVEQRKELRERAMGEWEGRLFREMHQQFLDSRTMDDTFGLSFQPPGGESINDVATRAKPLINEIVKKGTDAVIVSHGGALSVVLALFLGQETVAARSFKFSNASVTVLVRSDWNVFVIESYNCVAHLTGAESLQGSFDGSYR